MGVDESFLNLALNKPTLAATTSTQSFAQPLDAPLIGGQDLRQLDPTVDQPEVNLAARVKPETLDNVRRYLEDSPRFNSRRESIRPH